MLYLQRTEVINTLDVLIVYEGNYGSERFFAWSVFNNKIEHIA